MSEVASALQNSQKPFGRPDKSTLRLRLTNLGLMLLVTACGTSTKGYNCPEIPGSKIIYQNGVPVVDVSTVVTDANGVYVQHTYQACTLDQPPADSNFGAPAGSPDSKDPNSNLIPGCVSLLLVGTGAFFSLRSGGRKKRHSEPNPYAGTPRLKSQHYNRPYDSSLSAHKKRSKQERKDYRSEQRVRELMTEYELIPRPVDYETWPVRREHFMDTESVKALAEIYEELPDESYFISFISAIQRKQQEGVNEVFSKTYWYQRRIGKDGPVVVDPRKDYMYYLPGRKAIENFARRFFGGR